MTIINNTYHSIIELFKLILLIIIFFFTFSFLYLFAVFNLIYCYITSDSKDDMFIFLRNLRNSISINIDEKENNDDKDKKD